MRKSREIWFSVGPGADIHVLEEHWYCWIGKLTEATRGLNRAQSHDNVEEDEDA